ncbi:sensor histidine kinase [Brevibacterium spongiae]|uniref:histidine kinase n=1 Tax=Brevibacterium spongiae TaxID=2909672 RepID=A0ABY5SWE3_9MICO|nr:histidine kinase [Brevibacterium spongiae]UVI37356.1 histidine kinase [Brevibacterium spongiae]
MSEHSVPRRRIPRGVRIAGSILVGVIVYLIGIFTSSMAVTANPWAFSDGELNDTGLVAVLLLFLAWGLVFLRHRWPWVPFVVGGLLTAAWGDALMLLIAVFHLVIRAPKRQAITASAVSTGLVVFSTVRMCLAQPEHNPFSIFFLPDPAQVTGVEATIPPDDSHLAIRVITVAACLIGLGTALGVGALLRRTRRMRAVESIAERETLRNESLSAEIARQSERELLARELHDTLSHRLSVISLHTGALEVAAQTDPEVASTASALREEARASLEDLRHLVGGVRNGNLADPHHSRASSAPPSRATMSAIPELIASVASTGTIVRPLIVIQDVDSCPPALDRAVYRIVQEALTNAMKHAPNSPVTVDIGVSAARGVQLSVSNPLPRTPGPIDVPPRPRYAPDSVRTLGPDAAAHGWAPDGSGEASYDSPLASTGSGTGLVGIRERSEMFGGEASIGVFGEEFRVQVSFPPFRPQT